ncbi:hypothetical protein JAO29_16725 [Edaphobacter sp. HDX4]|uniref:hypothetical protein n=1 Tax=Edaphobacter sp. HDX4 TaxID=2794064 RepID=UPI002FE5B634
MVTKNLLSNLSRIKAHPTLNTVLEVADTFSLTLDGAHRVFGYDLEELRRYDFRLNSGRTRIIESYPFERDLLVELPLELGNHEAFARNAVLHELVSEWQTHVPIRALEGEEWQRPGTFYIQVGTEDSLGSSLPPGAIAMVEPIGDEERRHPDPRSIYLLQFGNGYRVSHCVVTHAKLLLLVPERTYTGPQEFPYPGGVRIAGRIRMFALALPMPDYALLGPLPSGPYGAPLILPWEHTSMDRLFAAKHDRFQRSREDVSRVRETLEAVFHTKISGRTERRYRHPTPSQPHVDALMQLALANVARYTDSLRGRRPPPSDQDRYSLDTLLRARHLKDLSDLSHRAVPPVPRERWTALRKDFVEWPLLLSMKFPQLRSWDNRIIRLPRGGAIPGIDPSIRPGSLLLIENVSGIPELQTQTRKTGWSRPIYALRRGAEIFCGYLQREGNRYALRPKSDGDSQAITFSQNELSQLHLVSGVAVPV